MNETDEGRARLAQWEAAKPTNFYTGNGLLQRLLERMRGGPFDERPFVEFGGLAATKIDDAARKNDEWPRHPRLARFDGIGRRVEEIEFDALYHQLGKWVYEAGLVARLAEPGQTWAQAALAYLLGHAGEMGHSCPVVCTSGLVRAIQQKGLDEMKKRWLPGLLDPVYESRLHAAQFLTEVQGGGDVGANAMTARPNPAEPGTWLLDGEKWFCSVADAALFLVTARPVGAAAGTAGLGCFLVPRHDASGGVNGFSIRRLKEKIGTRTLATAELDFQGAVAYPIGRLDEGFKIAVGIVLNTSRFMNAVGSTAAMRRAFLEATAYAAAREAFGQPIGAYPLVRETLAIMKAEHAGALAATFYLAELIDRQDLGTADADDRKLHRLLVNANKYWASIIATDAIHRGIEILGGNGAIESFSVLPRLWRDRLVLESWEGSHNVLCMQVLHDAARYELFAAADRRLRSLLDAADAQFAPQAAVVRDAWAETYRGLSRCVANERYGARAIRLHVEELMQAFQAALLLAQASWEKRQRGAAATAAVAEFLISRHLDRAYRPLADDAHPAKVDAVLQDG